VKRAQVTVFIILGILILATVVFFVYISTQKAKQELEITRPAIAKVPQEVQPVRDFIDACVRRVSIDAIKRAGTRGGFVDKTFAYNAFQPTEAAAVAFTDDASLVVPYWYHMKSPNDCTSDCVFELARPELTGPGSIEAQLGAYITDHVDECLDFTSFAQQGLTVELLEEPVLSATIAQDDVFVSGTIPVQVSGGAAATRLDDVYVPLDVDLRAAYELASELVDFQREGQFLEHGTRELITLFSGKSSDQLPPLYDFEISLDAPTHWIKQDVQKDVERIVSSHLSLVRASGTSNNRYVTSPGEGENRELYEVLYNRQFFIPLNGTYTNYAFRLMYLPWWKMYFDLNCRGQLCTADSTQIPLSFLLGMQEYNFAYDVSYPVLVVLEDPDAFGGEGFVFEFFMEANLRNNAPLHGATLLQPANLGEPSIVCNPDQFHSGNITMTVLDAQSKESIDGASVMYRCGQDQCIIGTTQDGILTAKYPKCVGGVLMVAKQGYMSRAGLATMPDTDAQIMAELTPRALVNVSARRFVMIKNGKRAPWKLTAGLEPTRVDPDEEVVILLKRKKAGPFDEEFHTVARLDGPSLAQIQLIPGKYEVQIFSVKRPEQPVRIMPDERCQEFGFFIFTDEECYTVPKDPLVFDSENALMYGGAQYNASIEVMAGDTIEFRYVAIGLDKIPERLRVIEDLDELSKVNMYSRAMSVRMAPVVR